MIQRDRIDILEPVQGKNTIGRVVTSYLVNRNISADFQPLSYNTQRKPYGITDKTSHLIFTSDPELMSNFNLQKDDPNQFNATYRIGFNNKQYIINSILPYKNHFEIYVEVVV